MEKGKISDIQFYLARKGEQQSRSNKEGRLIRLQERLVQSCLESKPGSQEYFRRLQRAKRFGGDQLVKEVLRRQITQE